MAGPTFMPALEADGTTIRNLYGTQNGSNQFSAGALLVHPTTGAPLIGPQTKANSLPVVQASDWTTELGTTAQATLQSGATANGAGTPATVGGYATALFAITGGGVGTVNFEFTPDGGTTWLPLLTTQMGTGMLASTANAAVAGTYRATIAGLDATNGLIRARISGYVSGAITVALTLSTVVAANKVVGQAPLNLAASGTANTLNGDVIAALDVSLYRAVSIQLTGTWNATVSPQVSVDGGTSWNNVVGYNVQSNAQAVNLTANGLYVFPLPPGAQFRLRDVSHSSGTVSGSVVFSTVASTPSTLTMLAGATLPMSAAQLPAALGPQTPGASLSIARPAATATLQSGATGTGNGAAWSVAGLEFATFHVGGITNAVITWETLNDATGGWASLLLTNQTNGALSATAAADGIYAVNCAGLNQIRARISAYTSGVISVLGRGA